MPFRDRFRRALHVTSLSDRSSSTSSLHSGNATTPSTPPSGPSSPTNTTSTIPPLPRSNTAPLGAVAPLTHVSTRGSSRLAKTLTWGSTKTNKSKREKQLEEWEASDKLEWTTPCGYGGVSGGAKRSGRKSAKHQEILRGFEWKMRNSIDGHRSESTYSNISPGCSRMGSIADSDGIPYSILSRRRASSNEGPLSKEVVRCDTIAKE